MMRAWPPSIASCVGYPLAPQHRGVGIGPVGLGVRLAPVVVVGHLPLLPPRRGHPVVPPGVRRGGGDPGRGREGDRERYGCRPASRVSSAAPDGPREGGGGRIRLATLCTAVGYRNPAPRAKIAARVDLIGGGRLTLGVGVGFFEEEYRQYGWDFPPLPARHTQQMEEAIRLIPALL